MKSTKASEKNVKTEDAHKDRIDVDKNVVNGNEPISSPQRRCKNGL